MYSKSKNLAFAAVMAALCVVATCVLAIPFPTVGYFNLGDVVVLLSGWLLGPLYGGLAAGLGSMLADLFLGFTAYMPATFLIKGGVAVCGWTLYTLLKKCIQKDAVDFLPRLLAGIAAEAVMVGGYLFFEAVCLGVGASAFASVIGNTVQALCGCVGATALAAAIYPMPGAKQLFPALCKKLVE